MSYSLSSITAGVSSFPHPHPRHTYAGTRDLIVMFLLSNCLIPWSSEIPALVLNQEPRLANLSELETENLGKNLQK